MHRFGHKDHVAARVASPEETALLKAQSLLQKPKKPHGRQNIFFHRAVQDVERGPWDLPEAHDQIYYITPRFLSIVLKHVHVSVPHTRCPFSWKAAATRPTPENASTSIKS